MSNEVIRLAYDEARAALKEQDATLSNVRNRATGLLAAATVGTSLAASVGLLNTDVAHEAVLPAWAGWAIVGLVVSIGIGVMAVLWPSSAWSFGPDAAMLLSKADADGDAVRRVATKAMLKAITSNDRLLKWRVKVYRSVVLVLLPGSRMLHPPLTSSD